MPVIHWYRAPLLSASASGSLQHRLAPALHPRTIVALETEFCFNVELSRPDLTASERDRLIWLLSLPAVKQSPLSDRSTFPKEVAPDGLVIEIAPRLCFTTPFSTNAVAIGNTIGLEVISRIELSKRYFIRLSPASATANGSETIDRAKVCHLLHDRMTEQVLERPLDSFEVAVRPAPIYEVNVLDRGLEALEEVNVTMGLAMDNWDMDYYTELFRTKLKRNPTNVECFDLAQSNSEHCRHGFFRGRLVIDGLEQPQSLFDMIMATQETSNPNNVIKFCDNSSAIRGYTVHALLPKSPGEPSSLYVANRERHICFTAETHNFPTGVAPFPGATTGTGGRIRDVQSTGRGAHVVAGTVGYSFGNLHLPDYPLPWETARPELTEHSPRFAPARSVAIEASDGASDYGNKFGEPVLTGFARSCGIVLPNGERREWIKPIMFSGGIGQMEASHVHKLAPNPDMAVVKIGGPVYRIGVGGGAASSVEVQGGRGEELDYEAVQRGDAEMEQKMNRVLRACIELGEGNPICSIHDQGAGGNGNVLKELVDPAGAVIEADAFQLGDPTISLLELWGAEYQESNAMLLREVDKSVLSALCARERCPVSYVGRVTGDGVVKLRRYTAGSVDVGEFPVNLELGVVLSKMPRKVFQLGRAERVALPLTLPDNITVMDALHRVLRLPSVASKRYLTNKVDRSVTGLVAQQQCVGFLHTPLADVAVVGLSYIDLVGSATAIGEQPIKGLLDPGAGARLSVTESLTNLALARVSALRDVKCSGNWMWAAKMPGEGAALHSACLAMCQLMRQLGIAVDGGKDSLSMAAKLAGGGTVKSPGCLVVSSYVTCPDISKTVTPDLKGDGVLLWIPLTEHARVGGTSLAQVYAQLGTVPPDLDQPDRLVRAFEALQAVIDRRLISAGHDISDGGWLTCMLEMAFAGHVGIEVRLTEADLAKPTSEDPVPAVLSALFHEEPGWIVEVSDGNLETVEAILKQFNAIWKRIGRSMTAGKHRPMVSVQVGVDKVIDNVSLNELRAMWEETSYRLELYQCAPACAESEWCYLKSAEPPLNPYQLSYDPTALPIPTMPKGGQPRVAIIREEGSNGDREMAAAFMLAGFEAWDINTEDLMSGRVTLDNFRGVAFVGGFSFADVLGSAKGWAGSLLFHSELSKQFAAFRRRPGTFSLGVCNGCQLMAWIGWIGDFPADHSDQSSSQLGEEPSVFLDHNRSERFESRFPTVWIPPDCKSVLLRGMTGSQLGVWVQHGEGQFVFRNRKMLEHCTSNGLIALQYVDNDGKPTELYPCNPNGSPLGIAGLCSSDGRHLALMPHPERCLRLLQWPYLPPTWRQQLHDGSWAPDNGPWLRLFQNAYSWCAETKAA